MKKAKRTKKEDMLLKQPPKDPKALRHGLPVLLGKLGSVMESTMGLGGGSSPTWSGMYVTDPRSQGSPVMPPATGFPFRTASAAKVWFCIQQVAKISPTMPVAELVKAGLDKSNVNLLELTPEDNKLLELATNWLVTGRAANQARATANPAPITKANGGEEGHALARKGYP